MGGVDVTFDEWVASVPDCIRNDSAWKMEAYRLGLFLSELAWHDATKLAGDRRTEETSNQLYRAVGKISSNFVEGYSRITGKGRALFYEYALGSARESRDWYYKGRHVLGERVTSHRMELCTQIVRISLTMVSNERATNRRIASRKGTPPS